MKVGQVGPFVRPSSTEAPQLKFVSGDRCHTLNYGNLKEEKKIEIRKEWIGRAESSTTVGNLSSRFDNKKPSSCKNN